MADHTLLGANQPDMTAWPADRATWVEAAGTVARHRVAVTPFEAKALFVIAGMRQRIETALFERERRAFLDAYGALAAAVESLGRCVGGYRDDPKAGLQAGARLREGFRTVLAPSGQVHAAAGVYDVKRCADLRNFVAHGATTPKPSEQIDPELVDVLLRRLLAAMDAWWAALGQDGDASRGQLERAEVLPLFTRGEVVFVRDMYIHLATNGGSPSSGYTPDPRASVSVGVPAWRRRV